MSDRAIAGAQIPNVVALVKPLLGTESDLPYVLVSRMRTPHMLDDRAATNVLQVRQFANSCWRRTNVTASSLE